VNLVTFLSFLRHSESEVCDDNTPGDSELAVNCRSVELFRVEGVAGKVWSGSGAPSLAPVTHFRRSARWLLPTLWGSLPCTPRQTVPVSGTTANCAAADAG